MADVVPGASDFLPLGFVLTVMLIGLACTALWVWSLVDALRITEDRWVMAGQSKILWVVLIAVLGLLGSILYVAMARPALGRTSRPGLDPPPAG
jgi:hypothetical protein